MTSGVPAEVVIRLRRMIDIGNAGCEGDEAVVNDSKNGGEWDVCGGVMRLR